MLHIQKYFERNIPPIPKVDTEKQVYMLHKDFEKRYENKILTISNNEMKSSVEFMKETSEKLFKIWGNW